MNTLHLPITILATVMTALVAGLFYSWSCGIIQGLGKLPDTEYINAFRSINREIQRPWFFISFMGNVLLLPLAAWMARSGGQHTSFIYLAIAAGIYLVGVFGITAGANVPLNNMLDQFDPAGKSAETIRAARQAFEMKWIRWNHIRTFFSILALVMAIVACARWKN